jgi:hypothetical protein
MEKYDFTEVPRYYVNESEPCILYLQLVLILKVQ